MTPARKELNRRDFLRLTAAVAGGTLLAEPVEPRASERSQRTSIGVGDLPKGSAPAPVATPHFPDRLHAFIWRNWSLVTVAKMAAVIGARPSDVLKLGLAMGLPRPRSIPRDQSRRSYITIVKRNWHLLPYEQLLSLLDWTPQQLEFALREDDFLYVKLGNLKPRCQPLKFATPSPSALARARQIASVLKEEFPRPILDDGEPLFHFVKDLSSPVKARERTGQASMVSPRFCYSYFALYGDPLLDTATDPYPDGYLARLRNCGVNGVWLQGMLSKLAPFPWAPELSEHYETRLDNLRRLVARARKLDIGIYLYLNEPRSMPLKFFAAHPELKGVVEGDYAALCTSHPGVRNYIRDALGQVCRAVPDLAGFFTITASENLSNCWSHGNGRGCPRCGTRSPADVVAEVNGSILQGIQQAGSRSQLIAWDWGWNDAWAGDVLRQLPREIALMSVSEWSLPIERGGVKTSVGEYSISSIGPGPRATRHWQMARERGMKTLAKIQAGNTWELSAVPYIPAVENVARHAVNLRNAKMDGLMLGWTLGGYPSPNLEVAAEISSAPDVSADAAMQRVAARRFGANAGRAVVSAWKQFSAAFSEFPFHGGLVYAAPLQLGPANPLWSEPTGYVHSMVGFPYDNLDGWRAVYPVDVFIAQFEKIAAGFERALGELRTASGGLPMKRAEKTELGRELDVAEAAAIHFKSVANQARFIEARKGLSEAGKGEPRSALVVELERVIRDELRLAKRLLAIQSRDSRIGFEASNHYFYVPADLVEKVLNCRDLLDRWLPTPA
ncbi:MAG: hypothetical protein QOF48_3710 [Verrucomicrobiota bacterium]|jgi:hypothetical protein